MADPVPRFHALFLVVAAGPAGITRGALGRRFRGRAVRMESAGVAALLERLEAEGAVQRAGTGRGERFRAGPGARAALAEAAARPVPGVHYAAAEVAAVLAFVAARPRTESIPDAVRALAGETATGLVTLAALRRRCGLDRAALHAAVRAAFEAGELLLHPIAARHQATAAEMADGIHTPGGQILFYVEPA